MAPSEMTLEELEAHIAEAKAALELKLKKRMEEAITMIEKMAAEVGLSVMIDGAAAQAGSPQSYERPAITYGVKTKGAKIPPKYRCPTTGKTWTGRGMRPNWMNGADPERFRI
jgi:DNA-binding protein H-NS